MAMPEGLLIAGFPRIVSPPCGEGAEQSEADRALAV